MTRVIQGTVLVDTLNIRTAPGSTGSTFNPPRYLHKGDKIEASENSNQWLHLSKINGIPVTDTEWASSGTAQNYITWGWVDVPVTPPPPPPPPPVEEDSMVCTIDFATNAVHVERNQNGTVFTGDVTLVQK